MTSEKDFKRIIEIDDKRRLGTVTEEELEERKAITDSYIIARNERGN